MAIKSMAGGGGDSGGGHPDEEAPEIFAEINITPLVDVFLVLLIIFMVTSSVMSQLGVNVDLPKASSETSESQPEAVIVTLLPGGSVQINERKIPPGQVEEMVPVLQGLFRATQSRTVILEGDREAFLGSAIQVMDLARKAGAEKFAIATAPSAGGK